MTDILPHNRSTTDQMQLVLLCKKKDFKYFEQGFWTIDQRPQTSRGERYLDKWWHGCESSFSRHFRRQPGITLYWGVCRKLQSGEPFLPLLWDRQNYICQRTPHMWDFKNCTILSKSFAKFRYQCYCLRMRHQNGLLLTSLIIFMFANQGSHVWGMTCLRVLCLMTLHCLLVTLYKRSTLPTYN